MMVEVSVVIKVLELVLVTIVAGVVMVVTGFTIRLAITRWVRFLAPGIVGWDPGEKRFLGRLPLGLYQVLGENSTHSSGLWLPWGEFP